MIKKSIKRFRARRIDKATREYFREVRLDVKDFIWPIFLKKGIGIKESISSMPGVYRYSYDIFIKELYSLIDYGLRSVLLFSVPNDKGLEQAWAHNGIIQCAIPEIKKNFPKLEIITDICICSYTEDGHCHIGDNDKTCEILAKIALSHARAGADIVAPSAMMDGQVLAIRSVLNKEGFNETKIMSYAAKFASNYYGPFRVAADCAPKTADRKTYQIDPPNQKEALEEIETDIYEGAQAVIVKPALAYLDVIAHASNLFKIPIIGFNVSGEYLMLYNLIQSGYANDEIVLETLIAIKRAGASRIISYFIPKVLPILFKKD